MTLALPHPFRALLLGALTFAVACEPGAGGKADADTAGVSVDDPDGDNDGFPASEDCNDSDPATSPGGVEICDGIDNNCDGEIDEGVTTTYYPDGDGDGFGDNSDGGTDACAASDGLVTTVGDCDDSNPDVHPEADETCNEVDDNCDGAIDEGVGSPWYLDEDGDGYGDADAQTIACEAPADHVDNDLDCDDLSPASYPGATETCDEQDNNCDGEVDEGVTTTFYADTDGDNYGVLDLTTEACTEPEGYASLSGDCDDDNNTVSPGHNELCNGIDDNCDGDTDEPTAIDAATFYQDGDTDGYGNLAVTQVACAAPSGFVADATDCDDTATAVNPGATEVCNGGVDDDCDGVSDDADASVTGQSTWYLDSDLDTFGQTATATVACVAPTNYVSASGDCDDGEATVNPGATEICNGGVDDDCNGLADDSDTTLDLTTRTTWYDDTDGDGYGDLSTATTTCAAPTATVTDSTDCDDTVTAVNPGATEVCNGGVDDDCNGVADDSDTTLDLTTRTTWHDDNDGDLYGDPSTMIQSCAQPTGAVTDGTDCNDGALSINPGATEICNSVDDDCDGDTDDADSSLDTSTASTWYDDTDVDGFGDPSTATLACVAPSGSVSDNTDCDDGDDEAYPGATEQCDGTDNDCDGISDNGALGTSSTCAATSCEDIITDDPTASSGAYYLDPEGNGVYLNYCDMSTSSGGWTLLFSCSAPDTTYGSGFAGWWSNGSTTTLDSTSDRGKSKAYDEVDFSEILLTATYPNTSRMQFSVGSVVDDMHDLVGARITTCSGLTGTGRHSYTSTMTGSYFRTSTATITVCDTDGSSLETTSAGNYDAAIFSSYTNHGDHNYAEGTIGAEYTCGGSSRGYGSVSSNILSVWVR